MLSIWNSTLYHILTLVPAVSDWETSLLLTVTHEGVQGVNGVEKS